MATMEKDTLKTLVELSQTALKAAESAEEHRCIDALNLLKTIPVTAKLLLPVKNTVRKIKSLKHHPIRIIQKVSADVISSWKTTIVSQKAHHNADEKHTSPTSTKQEKVAAAANVVSPLKIRIKLKKLDNAVQEKKSPAIQQPPPQIPSMAAIPKCNSSFRDKVREQIFEGLCKVYDESDVDTRNQILKTCDPVGVAVCLESALFEKLGVCSKGNNASKYRSLLFNIKDPKNKDFRRKVLLGQLKAEIVAGMNPLEMASDERKWENEKIKAIALKKRMVRKEDGANGSGLFKCEKCGTDETTYSEMQTRSADEPMTAFITCLNCHNHWKV